MVITRLNGGLGNQLFQYAAGFAIAMKNGQQLKLELSVFASQDRLRQTLRNPDILDFFISAPVATPEEIDRYRNPLGQFSEIRRLLLQKVFKRYYPDWHPEVMCLKGDAYLDGYFQSEKYFMSCLDSLMKEFTLRPDREAEIQTITSRITAMRNPVSLHVRRGDYVYHVQHEICTADYYRSALSLMSDELGRLDIVVFSDDVEWVRANLDLTPDTLIISDELKLDGSNFSPTQELILMSRCHHHVISNSTFSWWGAYLNRRAGKVVVAPAIWNRSRLYPHNNIVPAGWRRIAVSR
ncbi:MAG: alpha-1,2-fucosyltransferase [Chlorobiaceae bacterium]|nr:alpha-1,2-fucosyltransferase [Chlorobiaceae bacterium]